MIVTRMDGYLKKAGEYIGRNVVIITISMKIKFDSQKVTQICRHLKKAGVHNNRTVVIRTMKIRMLART